MTVLVIITTVLTNIVKIILHKCDNFKWIIMYYIWRMILRKALVYKIFKIFLIYPKTISRFFLKYKTTYYDPV